MSLDLRIPMGLRFTLVGAVLTIYGFVIRGSAIYKRSAGMAIDLICGVVNVDLRAGYVSDGPPPR